MPTLAQLKANRDAILDCAERNGAFSVRIFGSVSRGTQRQISDVDFLVCFRPQCTLLDHIELVQELADLLQMKVDVVSEDGLSPHIRERVLADAVVL